MFILSFHLNKNYSKSFFDDQWRLLQRRKKILRYTKALALFPHLTDAVTADRNPLWKIINALES